MSNDMNVFSSEDRLACRIGIYLGNNESAGKKNPADFAKAPSPKKLY